VFPEQQSLQLAALSPVAAILLLLPASYPGICSSAWCHMRYLMRAAEAICHVCSFKLTHAAAGFLLTCRFISAVDYFESVFGAQVHIDRSFTLCGCQAAVVQISLHYIALLINMCARRMAAW
jgi:hypothetical protein